MNDRFHTGMSSKLSTLATIGSMLKGVIVILLIVGAATGPVAWTEVPSIRTGQIESVTNLMTAEDISTNITDISVVFINSITGAATIDLKTGVSLISYESWMTDTFSYNVSIVTHSNTGITVRFNVLDNTFFSKAKVHYIVVWRTNSNDNHPGAANHTHDLDVIYGCYLTTDLLIGTGWRNQTVGNITTNIANNPTTVVKSFISGMQLSNSVGKNDYVKIDTQYSAATAGLLLHTIFVENNNFLTFTCLTTLVYDNVFSTTSGYSIIQTKTYTLNTTNSGLLPIPYMERYDGLSRMFFGISEFNLSMSDTRYLNVETANISLVSLLYDKNNAMNQITYNMFFFAKRVCSVLTEYYDPITYTCVTSCPSTSIATPAYLLCKPCHYSCITCTIGLSPIGCSGVCNTTNKRVATSVAGKCDCAPGFVDVGVAMCDPCSNTLVGCSVCSTPTVCTTCLNSTYTKDASNTICICAGTTYMASTYCLPYPGCLVARYFLNNITCDVCDTSKNYIQLSNFTCGCNLGFILNISTLVCQDICNDSIAAFGKCDDGGNSPGDGCDQFCNVESGYYCSYTLNATGWPGRSTCTLKEQITIKYLYAERFINSNRFQMAFSLQPAQAGLTASSFAGNFNTSMPITNQQITFDPVTSTIYLEGEYMESIQGTLQKIQVSFNNMSFYADQRNVSFNAVGVNAQLVLEEYATPNTILKYIVMGIGLLALILAIFSSVVGLKLVGIQLLIPIQIIYFSLATIPNHTTYTFILSDLKYANGYNTIQTYDYFRTHTQNKNLVGINYETQFLLSTNIMLAIFVLVLLWLLIHHFRLKYKEYKLEKFLQTNVPPVEGAENRSHDSQEDKEDGQQDQEKVKLAKRKRRGAKGNDQQQEQYKLREDHHRSFKVFTFEVDRIYFVFYLILINQMMFGFVVMTLNVPIGTFYFPEEINVLICNFLFFIFIGNIVFISYDQESNKMIAFTCIKDRYAYIYLLLNFIIITTLSMTFQESFSTYLVTVLSFSYLVLIFKQRPYSSILFSFQNVVALYLHFMLAFCLILLCIIRADSTATEKTQLIETYIIVALILIGEILTIVRIAAKVNFKKAFDDLKNPNEQDDSDKKKKKVIEKNLDLLEEDKNLEIIPPDSVRNGLFTPKDKMIDWESKNTDEYESMKQRQVENHETGDGSHNNNRQPEQDEQASQNKEQKLNELQILKKRLRNNLKLKKEAENAKKDK